MKTVLTLLIIGFFFMGCQKSEKEIAGIYLKSPSVNVIDSLFIPTDCNIHKFMHVKYISINKFFTIRRQVGCFL